MQRNEWSGFLLFFFCGFLGAGEGGHTKPTREGAKLGWVTCRACRGPGERRTREPYIQMHGGHAGGPKENLRVGKFCQEKHTRRSQVINVEESALRLIVHHINVI